MNITVAKTPSFPGVKKIQEIEKFRLHDKKLCYNTVVKSTVFFMLSFVRELTCLAEKLIILFLMLEKGRLFSFEHSELGNKGF